MGTFSEKRNAIGAEGYCRFQQEVTYGNGIMTSPIYLPILPDTLIKGWTELIEKGNVINSRLKQNADLGRKIVEGVLTLDIYPDLAGKFFNWLLGLSSNAGGATTGYVHTWLAPANGTERIATCYTLEQAIGEQLATQYEGCILKTLTIKSDNQKNITISAELVGENYTRDKERPESVSISSLIPYHFGQGTIELTPTGTTKFVQTVKSFELKFDMNYDTETWYVGSTGKLQPHFKGIPITTFKTTIDADENFRDYALAQILVDIDIALASGQQAGSESGNYAIAIELPGCRLSPETEIANSMEYGEMELEFDCSYGGKTTGSPTDDVMFEVRVTDATDTYPAMAS